jgi:hypothetical protein
MKWIIIVTIHSWHNSVSVMTDHRQEKWRQMLAITSISCLDPPDFFCTGQQGNFAWGKPSEHEPDHAPQPKAKVKLFYRCPVRTDVVAICLEQGELYSLSLR